MSKSIFYPSYELRPYIEHFLFLDIQLDRSVVGYFCSVPSGCCVMNIFYSSDLPSFIFPNKTLANLRGFVGGYLCQGVKLGIAGHFKCVLIKFTPLGAYHLFRIPPSEYCNTFVNAEDLLGYCGTELIEKINLAKSIQEIIDHLNSFFCKFLLRNATSVTVAEHILNNIIRSKGITKVDELTKCYDISLRKLDRHFNNLLGISPKEYAWLTRLNLAYLMLFFNKGYEITDVMFALGYYDQSHMIRHFLKYSDITPLDLHVANGKTLFSSMLMISPDKSRGK